MFASSINLGENESFLPDVNLNESFKMSYFVKAAISFTFKPSKSANTIKASAGVNVSIVLHNSLYVIIK